MNEHRQTQRDHDMNEGSFVCKGAPGGKGHEVRIPVRRPAGGPPPSGSGEEEQRQLPVLVESLQEEDAVEPKIIKVKAERPATYVVEIEIYEGNARAQRLG